MSRHDEPGLVLTGLDGRNPLGFLAAVGAVRTATLAEPGSDWRMKWLERRGTWLPELSAARALSRQELVALLMPALRPGSTPEFDFDKNLAVSPEEFREAASRAQCRASRLDRRYADFMASFGCEALTAKDRRIQDTALRTMSGAGNQHFLGTMKQLVHDTDDRDLQESLFESWTYKNKKLGLRWDPQEDRRYALRWDNPSGGAGVPTMRGANRLAVEALPLLPAVPVGRRLETTGFTRHDRAVYLAWPIWERALPVEVIRSLLALGDIQAPAPDWTTLRARGIIEIYRSRRISNDRYRNFTPAYPA